MITWNKKLYLGEGVKKGYKKVIYKIEEGKPTFGIYCIMFASNDENLFDIIPVMEFFYPVYEHRDIHILGLAKGKGEAIEVAKDMIMEVYNKTGEFKVREYF